jgi:hypothetical protein
MGGRKMISEASKVEIDSLSKSALRYEIERGRESRYQGDRFAYLQTRLAELEELDRRREKAAELAVNRSDQRFNRITASLGLVIALLGLVGGTGWYQAFQAKHEAESTANQRLISDVLQPISGALSDNVAIYNELSSPPYAEPGWGILDSYLIKIGSDPKGIGKNAYMKSQIDVLVGNDQKILSLLDRYEGKAKTQEFSSSAKAFRDHATRYISRWHSLLEIYVSGGRFPTGQPAFPEDFPQAVANEIAARQKDG